MNKLWIAFLVQTTGAEYHKQSTTTHRPRLAAYSIIHQSELKNLRFHLLPLMPDIVAKEQSAFIGDRQIQDNIFIVQEVLHQLKVRTQRKKFQAILKLDTQKAYDRVEWDFLQGCMIRMGFNEKWVGWIMQCVTTVSFSVKLNGEPLPYFRPTRGIRQGDPLSPYLFLLVANCLSFLMENVVANESIKGINLNASCPTLTQLLFVDDSIFFLDGTVMECQNISSILNQYCFATGQVVNLNKSGIFF